MVTVTRLVEGLARPCIRLGRILAQDLGLIPRSFQVLAYPSGNAIKCRVRSRGDTGRPRRWRDFSIRRDTTDWHVFEQMFVDEHYRLARLARAPSLRATYDRIIADGRRPLIVDCGANIGMSTVYFEECFPEALVVAIEPERSNFEVLRRTVRTQESSICLNAAISNADGEVRLVDPGYGQWGFQTTRSSGSNPNATTVPALSFRTVLAHAAEQTVFEPFLAKVDIEGAEEELFASDTAWVDLFPVIVIELHDWMLPGTGNSQNFLKTVAALDRDFVYVGENVFSISNRLG